MSLATIVVRGHDNRGKEVEAIFTATQQRPDEAFKFIRSQVSAWSRHDRAVHVVTKSGKALGQRITAQITASAKGRTVEDAVHTLKIGLERNGMAVCSQSHSYRELESQADIGLPV